MSHFNHFIESPLGRRHITIVEDSETPVVVGQQVDGKWPADEVNVQYCAGYSERRLTDIGIVVLLSVAKFQRITQEAAGCATRL